MLTKPDAHAFTPLSLLTLALATALLCLNSTPAQAGTVSLARLGPCFTPPNPCVVDIPDNSPLDQNPALGVIDFATSVGQPGAGVYVASGRAIEIITLNEQGQVVGLFWQLTNTTVLGTVPGLGAQNIFGQITLISSVPIQAASARGFAGLSGQYESPSGHIQFADIAVETRVGGLLFGRVDPRAAVNVTSPVVFGGFNSRVGGPINNLLFGIVNFEVSLNSGFTLPSSAEFSVEAVPEPASLLLLGAGLTGVAIKMRKRLKTRKSAQGSQ